MEPWKIAAIPMNKGSLRRNIACAIAPGYGFTGMCPDDENRRSVARPRSRSFEYIEYKILESPPSPANRTLKRKKAPRRGAAQTGASHFGAS
ncbi:hypothetical protein [Pandoraea eparura]|jgi:hypothetical protein|uniref:hypothetical protein n=1 Tax=Pandoraea eparura TaxID=2508291 RepID=UPI00123FA1D1|nr:hypothetical protein [Pandoraea eparura]